MTITSVLHVGSSGKMDSYSSAYFGVEGAKSIFDLMHENLYAYGVEAPYALSTDLTFRSSRAYYKRSGSGTKTDPWTYAKDETVEAGKALPVPNKIYYVKAEGNCRCVDLKGYMRANRNYVFPNDVDESEATFDNFEIENPLVPPSQFYVAPNEKGHDTKQLNYWLHYYDYDVPEMIRPQTNKYIRIQRTGADDKDFVFSFNKIVIRPENSVAVINGFFCYPSSSQPSTVMTNDAGQYIRDQRDRDRGAAIIDFTRVGGCTFHRFNTLNGNIHGFELPRSFDSKQQSVIVIVAGRVLTQDVYSVVDRSVHISPTYFTVEEELDRMICAGKRIDDDNKIITCNGLPDYYNDSNSFVIIVNTPNLQILEHKAWNRTDVFRQEQGIPSFAAIDKNHFDSLARGLLYDRRTRSVYDYARELHTVTFYAGETDGKLQTWRVSAATIKPERPLVILANSRDNLMSAKAMVLDKTKQVSNDDVVVWPEFVILDFIFRG